LPPTVEGLDAEVLNFDDRIQLRNNGDEAIVVEGYRGEPYLRFEPDGTVSVNRRSPAAYLNEDRFADVEVPATADTKAAPEWETVARNGRYDWHDHRNHWMSKTPPERVREDGSACVEVFRWKLPLSAGGAPHDQRQPHLVPRLPLRGLAPGGYRVKVTAYDWADNRSRTLVRRFRLR
jgi:hypothetical protein